MYTRIEIRMYHCNAIHMIRCNAPTDRHICIVAFFPFLFFFSFFFFFGGGGTGGGGGGGFFSITQFPIAINQNSRIVFAEDSVNANLIMMYNVAFCLIIAYLLSKLLQFYIFCVGAFYFFLLILIELVSCFLCRLT